MREYHSEKRAVYFNEVLRLYYDEGYGVRRISRILPISPSAVSIWIRTFAGKKPQRSYTMGKKKEELHSVVDQGQEETMEGLRKRIKSLETQLSKAETRADKAEIKAEAFKTLIEVAESKGMPVRKKAGVKQS